MPHEMGADATRERKSDTVGLSLERSNKYGIMGITAQHVGCAKREADMKVLVMGAGRMGAIRVEDLAADPRVTEVMITNRNQPKAQALADQFGATVVPWDNATDKIADAVVVAVGTDGHEFVLNGVLPHALPVLCEKPIALTLEGTQAAIDLAQRSGSSLQIGFQRRFDSAIREVHDTIESGAVGTLYALTMTAHDFTPSTKEFMGGSGGIFRDLHVHDFDLIRWLTGSEIEKVYATKAVREFPDYAEFDDADVTSINATTVSGVQVTVSGTRHGALGHDVRLEVFGSTDTLSAGLNQRTPLRTMEGDLALNTDAYHGFVDRFRDAFRNETQSFVSFALGDIANPCPPESALESLRAAIACEHSIISGSAVEVAQVA
jgi:myo-inositol 2-dehydrogenase/D-chiro-inositol 1-dehydrogenase